ncbi:diuretic hormone 45 isoform X1 [Papilio machaon]|uniref:diuretic hormone 45 isoform X1 n=1 Tax=Papilio machaon TaxID=76193 RepID=UPI001E665AC8|nr:diuretic hormone 45 isoform X1 [Papilio machaon]XP_045542400.1 diuretic hormone 45 isoform X1 [Papilio machaon]
MMWWAVWCVAVVGAGAMAAAAPSDGLVPISSADWDQIDASTTDDENMGNAVAPLGGRYAAAAPWLYLLADMPKDSQRSEWLEGRSRPKRKMPSLSINNPMEVLRQRLLLEVARKQMREANQRQAVVNRLFLQNVGKRAFWANQAPSRYEN